MSNVLNVKQEGQPVYDIVIAQSLDELASHFAPLALAGHHVCIVSDSNVAPLHADAVKEALSPLCKEIVQFVFPAGEAHKTLDVVRELYAFLIAKQFDRKDCLVALGGGVVGDLTGFAAATYLRGISYIQMPTSLLAMVDSSIGGKTGVDFDAYKNMVGAFKMPRLVYMNLSFLDTLPEAQYFNGMAEIIKHGLIRDLDYYVFILTHLADILTHDKNVIAEMITESCKIKRAVVEEDPTEKGIRALLNFGHTAGHAIEKLKHFKLLHGESVALGMVCAAYISWQRDYLTEEEFYEIRDILVAFRLPVTVEELSAKDIVAATKSDKKMDSGKIRFVLLKEVGQAYIDTSVTDEELTQALKETVLKISEDNINTAFNPEIIKMSDIIANMGDTSDTDTGVTAL